MRVIDRWSKSRVRRSPKTTVVSDHGEGCPRLEVGVTPRLASERALFKRLIIAWQDLGDAQMSIDRVLSGGSIDPDDVVHNALITTVIVSYGRCFTAARGPIGVATRLPRTFERRLDKAERTLHHRLLSLHDKEFAHSDADAADVAVFEHDSLAIVVRLAVATSVAWTEEPVRR